MYNAREAASGKTVSEIQEFYKRIYPRIQSYQGEVWAEKQKNKREIGLAESILDLVFTLTLLGAAGTLIYLLGYSIANVKDSFTLSMIILGILIGGPIFLFVAFMAFMLNKPSNKETYIKFPLKEDEKKMMDLIKKFAATQGCGKTLRIYVNNHPATFSLKEPLPSLMLFQGTNEDASKRSFVFEVVEDEITILLPDKAGVYKYASKTHLPDIQGLPDGNGPQQLGDAGAMIDSTFF